MSLELNRSDKLQKVGFVVLLLYSLLLTGCVTLLFIQHHHLRKEVHELRRDETIPWNLKSEESFHVDKREVISNPSIESLLKLGLRGPPGPPGPPGPTGRDGRDAVNLASVDRHISTSVSNAVDVEMKRVQEIARTVPTVSGAVYTRYGRAECPPVSNLVFMGRVGGTFFSTVGGSSQYICLPDDPEYLSSAAVPSVKSIISGTEYASPSSKLFGTELQDHNVPCAVCDADVRANKIMIPAKVRCPDSTWTLEYKGYLMSDPTNYSNHARTEYICVDEKAEPVPGMQKDLNGATISHTTVSCNTFGHCPPYKTDQALSCVVCTK